MMGSIPNLWMAILAVGGLALSAILITLDTILDKIAAIFRRKKDS